MDSNSVFCPILTTLVNSMRSCYTRNFATDDITGACPWGNTETKWSVINFPLVRLEPFSYRFVPENGLPILVVWISVGKYLRLQASSYLYVTFPCHKSTGRGSKRSI